MATLAGVGADRARRVELADIVRAHGAAYQRAHPLCRAQRRALRAIATCRTAALGGHRAVCSACGAERITYNSCRNRHCPKCQRVATERWLAARRAEVLPIPYFHVVFTLPHELNPLAQSHPRLVYRLLFHAAASTLLRFGRDPRHLGGELGVTAVLHTWGQTLTQPVHVHCVVTGGALARDGARWIPAHPAFLFPVRALATVFRGRYLARLQRAFDRGKLHLTGGLAPLGAPAAFTAWLEALRAQAWVVYCQPPFAGPEHVLAYLGRYTHRVALSNDRLVALADDRVRFRWRDYADGDRGKIMALAVDEFLRRFLLHIVPDGFVRIRHFGLLANRRRAAALAQCRALLAQPPPPPAPPESARDLLLRLTGLDIERCPVCQQGRLRQVETLPPAPAAWDTS
ncbi:MAG: IS91 family transposase [Candidatus Rokubacteria bacterium]|nr:IS91 family transposase [Candidatus Rokubacteria bacterium]